MPMTKKILLLVMLAAFAAIATEALSQSPGGTSPPASAPSAKDATSKLELPAAKDIPSSKDFLSGKVPAVKDFAKDLPSSKSAATGKDASPSTKTIPTSTVVPGSAPSARTVTVERALVTLIYDTNVPATEAGMLMEVPVKEGHSVEKGTILAQIDNRSTLAKQNIARAEHEASLAQAANTAEIEVADAAIKVAKAELDQDLEIQKSTPQAVSKSQIRKDEFNLDKAIAQKKQAVSEKHIAGLTANAKMAQYEAASIELDLRQVRAPYHGEVVDVMKHPGDWVTAGEPIMHVVGLDKVRVKGYVYASGPDGASPSDVDGKDVKITVEVAGGKKATVHGKIGFASPVIEGVGTSRQFRVLAEVDNEKIADPVTKKLAWKLQPGSVATMTIDLTDKPQPAAKSESTKTQAYKPVTGDEKSGGKKSAREF